MGKLLIVCVSAFFLCCLSESMSATIVLENGQKSYLRKEKLFFFLSALILAVFCGLRTRGNDTYAYRHFYETLPNGIAAFQLLRGVNLADSPALIFIAACLRYAHASVQTFLMVWALITIFLYLWFIRKYSSSTAFSFFFFVTMGIYTFTMAAMKQTLAVAVLMIATDRIIQKRKLAFLFWVAVAMLFHPYAFVYLVLPFLFFEPWTKGTWYLLAGTAAAALLLSYFLGGILDVTEALGYDYSDSMFAGEGVNVLRVAVVWVPVVLSFLFRFSLQNDDNQLMGFFINASMVCSMIMFIGLFGTANTFARLANYFLVFQTISLPYLIGISPGKDRRILTAAAVLLFSIYFAYSCVVNGGFSNNYSFMSLSDYLKQIRVLS